MSQAWVWICTRCGACACIEYCWTKNKCRFCGHNQRIMRDRPEQPKTTKE